MIFRCRGGRWQSLRCNKALGWTNFLAETWVSHCRQMFSRFTTEQSHHRFTPSVFDRSSFYSVRKISWHIPLRPSHPSKPSACRAEFFRFRKSWKWYRTRWMCTKREDDNRHRLQATSSWSWCRILLQNFLYLSRNTACNRRHCLTRDAVTTPIIINLYLQWDW